MCIFVTPFFHIFKKNGVWDQGFMAAAMPLHHRITITHDGKGVYAKPVYPL